MRHLRANALAFTFPFAALSLFAVCNLAACDSGTDPTGTSTSSAGGGATTGVTTSGDATTTSSTGGAPPVLMRKTINGDATWSVTFDDAAKMAGATDCSYTRHFDGVEDRSAPWLCPDCQVMYKVDVTLTAGKTECFDQISPDAGPSKVEWLGYSNGTWFRGAGGPMTDQGMVSGASDALSVTNMVPDLDAPAGGKMQFAIAGTFAEGMAEGDPMNGFTPSSTYTCAWATDVTPATPAAYAGDYTVKVGQTLPDGTFKDACDEIVRLHDLKGTYLVVDMAAIDCPPCNQMAAGAEQFVADMKAKGIDVRMVTLMAPSLANPLGNTTKTQLTSWTTKYKLHAPVLADRGWGISMFEPIYLDMLGYPGWAIVDPNLKVLKTGVGFGDYTEFDTTISADAGL
jgi:hypothetical protein